MATSVSDNCCRHIRHRLSSRCNVMLWAGLLLAMSAGAHGQTQPAAAKYQEVVAQQLQPLAPQVIAAPLQAVRQYQALLNRVPPARRDEWQLNWCWLLAPYQPDMALALRLSGTAGRQAQLRLTLCHAYATEINGDLTGAMQQYQQLAAEPLLQQLPAAYSRLLMLRGERYTAQGLYSQALADLHQAFSLLQQQGDQPQLSYLRTALANLYADPEVAEYDQALRLYGEALAESQASANQKELATALFNIGSTWQKKGDYQQARQYLQQAIAIDQQLQLAADVAWGQRSLAQVLNQLEQPQQALQLIEQALSFYRQQNDAQYSRYSLFTRAQTLLALRRFAEAERDFNRLTTDQALRDDARLAAAVYRDYARLHLARGRYPQALQWQQQHYETELRRQKELAGERASALKAQLETAQISAEKRELALQNHQQGQQLQQAGQMKFWQWLTMLLSLLLLVVLALWLQRTRRLSQRFRALAELDELTRLPNRRHILALAADAFRISRQQQWPLSVLAVDIDWFKQINDTFGHQAGDLVLQQVAHQLRQMLRPEDKVGRVGGEEFLLLLGRTSPDEASTVAERIRQAVASIRLTELNQQVTVSLGLAGLQQSDADFAALWRRADLALYQAKSLGRNRVAAAG